jgi:hypothetical protein
MFYAGAPFVAKGYAYRNYGYEDAARAVDMFLDSYNLASATGEAPAQALTGASWPDSGHRDDHL